MALREELQSINRRTEENVRSQLNKAVNNVAAHIRYEFLEENGPKRERVTHSHPLVPRLVVNTVAYTCTLCSVCVYTQLDTIHNRAI